MGEWIEWSGGDQPVYDEVGVEVELRSGDKGEDIARAWCWKHWLSAPNNDIVRYRVVT